MVPVNSAAIRINRALLKQIKVDVGASLVVEVCNGGLLLKPVTEPPYSLIDLLTTALRPI